MRNSEDKFFQEQTPYFMETVYTKLPLEGRENGLQVSGIDVATGQPFTTTVAPENLATYYGELNDIAEEFVEDSDYISFRQFSLRIFPSSQIFGEGFPYQR